MIDTFLMGIQFFTCIPIKKQFVYARFSAIIYWMPLYGCIIGGINYASYHLSQFFFPKNISVLIALFSNFIITSAIHMDGFCDFFDGVFTNGSKERKIKAMKDPRLGAAGTISLFFLLCFKFLSLQASKPLMMIIMAIWGKCMLPTLLYRAKFSTEGSAKALFLTTSNISILFSCLMGGVVAICYLKFGVILLFLCQIMLFFALKKIANDHFGGINGDVLGTYLELSEVLILLCATTKLR